MYNPGILCDFFKAVLRIICSFGLEFSTRLIEPSSEVNGSFCLQAFITAVLVNV